MKISSDKTLIFNKDTKMQQENDVNVVEKVASLPLPKITVKDRIPHQIA